MPAKMPAIKTLQTGQVFQDLNRSSFSISLLLPGASWPRSAARSRPRNRHTGATDCHNRSLSAASACRPFVLSARWPSRGHVRSSPHTTHPQADATGSCQVLSPAGPCPRPPAPSKTSAAPSSRPLTRCPLPPRLPLAFRRSSLSASSCSSLLTGQLPL